MQAVWEFYGPWLSLMLWVGVPLLVIGTVLMLLFERGSLLGWAAGRVALLGWTLALIAAGGYGILRVLERAFLDLPGM